MKHKFLFIIVIALFLLVSCTNNGYDADSSAIPDKPKVTIRFMAYNTKSVRSTYLDYLAAKLPDINIQYEYVPLEYYSNTLSQQLFAGNGPDIIEVGGETRLLASMNCIMDLTNQPFVSEYSDEGLSAYSFKNCVYATPLQSWFEGIFYNKTIFEQNGIEPPKNFEEFIQIHKKLQSVGIKPQTMGAESWEPLMKQSVGIVNNEFYSLENNAGFDEEFDAGHAKLSESWLPAVTTWSRMISEGCLTPDMLGYSYEQALDEFASGQAAMWQSGPWSLGAIMNKNPDIKLGMFPIPGTSDGAGWLVGGPGSAIAINNNSPSKEAALRILECTATEEAQTALIADSEGLSYVKGVKIDLGPVYDGCKQAFASGNIYAPWTTAWTYGNPVVEAYGKSLQEVLAGTKTVEQALRDADAVNERLREILK